ncbi:MAG TPA: anti-sigma factor antagonist [Thiomicrospira sp.]|jgi:anti-anti-sigma factor|nr:anti-sigma factor antagonist [Thiomicrospira sp.]
MSFLVKVNNNLISIGLTGSFEVSQYQAFRALCEKYNQPECKFVIDFSETEYMDSSALGMLLLLREQTEGDKSRVQLINVRDSVSKILDIAHFDRLFSISKI